MPSNTRTQMFKDAYGTFCLNCMAELAECDCGKGYYCPSCGYDCTSCGKEPYMQKAWTRNNSKP